MFYNKLKDWHKFLLGYSIIILGLFIYLYVIKKDQFNFWFIFGLISFWCLFSLYLGFAIKSSRKVLLNHYYTKKIFRNYGFTIINDHLSGNYNGFKVDIGFEFGHRSYYLTLKIYLSKSQIEILNEPDKLNIFQKKEEYLFAPEIKLSEDFIYFLNFIPMDSVTKETYPYVRDIIGKIDKIIKKLNSLNIHP